MFISKFQHSNTGLYSESVKSSSQAISSKSILIYPLIFPYDSKTASYASTPNISHHMEAQTVFTMLEKLAKLTQLIIQEDFIAFSRHNSLKSYVNELLRAPLLLLCMAHLFLIDLTALK
jgi:hypothetical protein